MAKLPPDGEYLIQQIGGQVVLYRQGSEEELVRFDVTDADATARAQYTIYSAEQLTAEQKCFAHFWCGYFHAHVGGDLTLRLMAVVPLAHAPEEDPRIVRALEAWENYEAVFEDKFPNQHAREMFEEIRKALKHG